MSATREIEAPPGETSASRPAPSVWRELLAAAGTASVLAFAVIAPLLGDLEAAAYAAAFGVGLALLRVRGGSVGVIVLALLSLNVVGWMSLGALSNLRGGEGALPVAIPALLAVLALTAVVAALADLVRRSRPGGSRAAVRAVAAGAAVVFAALAAAGALTGTDGVSTPEGDLTVVSDNIVFEPTQLEATAGEITLHTENRDLFWHTVTIDTLDVDLPVAVGGTASVTFEAPAGTYSYYCRIPGHETRMQGTLTVRD